MEVYVGRWDMLPQDWEGINGLYEKSKKEIRQEALREEKEFEDGYDEGPTPGVYSITEFEEEFNGDNEGVLHGKDYWIKIIA